MLFVSVAVLILIVVGVYAWGAYNRKPQPGATLQAVPRDGVKFKVTRDGGTSIRLQADDTFVAQMKQLAAESNGEVEVLERTGRRTTPYEVVVTPLANPAKLLHGTTLYSCAVSIDGVRYQFHAYVHPKRNIYWDQRTYYTVTGPRQKDGLWDQFDVTDQFRWTVAERPWSPLLVTSALKSWTRRRDVVEAIAIAKRRLPILPERPGFPSPLPPDH